ncbi:MAG TPA: glucose-6-phosphate dehydrogenase [Candidatus Polarisedimenticolaceae bacterium]|nr:glucose-6-phosphate dehydrogenase [Candidatus Polarisedimenticolaceae bacterium]
MGPTSTRTRGTDGLSQTRPADPCAVVIIGASGDLTRRKLIPALYNLRLDGLLPERFAVVGTARSKTAHREFVDDLEQGIRSFSRQQFDAEQWRGFSAGLSYVSTGDGAGGYAELKQNLEQLDRSRGTAGNRLYYLSVPPSAIPAVIEGLRESGLNRPTSTGWTRIVIEKPIGHDLDSARRMNATVERAFKEPQIFRIDHYLGKETVQNLMVFRFANAIFEPLWNQKYVDHVQVTVAESIGVEGRGAYYESAGATRDVLQNHMFQLLCLIGMEPPVSLAPDAIRDEKVKVLEALRPVDPTRVAEASVRGQYAAGVIDGKEVVGYLAEEGVAPDSLTETYVALRLYIDNWRWGGVPFYLRAGKRLNRRLTEIALRFNDVPHRLFPNDPPKPNTLVLQVQPDEGINLVFDVKVPGAQPRIKPVEMEFSYRKEFGGEPSEAYERLLLDAILGDSTLFIRRDEVEGSWRYVDRLLEGWARDEGPLPQYTAGTWGPAEAHVMLAADGRTWRRWR